MAKTKTKAKTKVATPEISHAPGPWAFMEGRRDMQQSCRVHKAADKDFAIALVNCDWFDEKQRAEDVANARLIAASPDLYAACDKLLDAAARGCPEPERMLNEAIELAKDAIAKARYS